MQKSIQIVRDNRRLIGRAGLIFLIGIILGVLMASSLESIMQEQLEFIQEIGEKITSHDNILYGPWYIFWNNLKAAIMLAITGIFFAIIPIAGLMMNGLLVGMILAISGQGLLTTILLVLAGILPHGIFEIPAILIAGGLGLKLGQVLWKPLPNMSRLDSIKAVYLEIYQVMTLIIVLLIVAALVEGLITPVILQVVF